MAQFLDSLARSLGTAVVTAGPDVPPQYRSDWAGLEPVCPMALVRPRTTQEVAQALRICHEAGVPVVPQGGLTGISGAAHPVEGCVALSLERLNRIERVDPRGATMTCGAGVVLQQAQEAAEQADMLLAIDIGARGSCQLGGLIATNAGGHNVLRYGMTRDQVLGLEVVLADGTVLNDMNTLIKNNAGLDLRQLFIGSEGLLGVVTTCVLRLHPATPARETALIGCNSTADAIAILARARRDLGPMLSTFEVMWSSFHAIMSARCDVPMPLGTDHPLLLIVEATGSQGELVRASFESLLEQCFDKGLIRDAVLASSGREEADIWAVRETPAEYATVLGPVIPFDIGLPTDRMTEAVEAIDRTLKSGWPDVHALFYGHIGDNNLHLVVNVPSAGATQPEAAVKAAVYGLVREMEGTVSAEHGIGRVKRDYMHYSRNPVQIALMQRLKDSLDPKGILNPGVGFAGLGERAA